MNKPRCLYLKVLLLGVNCTISLSSTIPLKPAVSPDTSQKAIQERGILKKRNHLPQKQVITQKDPVSDPAQDIMHRYTDVQINDSQRIVKAEILEAPPEEAFFKTMSDATAQASLEKNKKTAALSRESIHDDPLKEEAFEIAYSLITAAEESSLSTAPLSAKNIDLLTHPKKSSEPVHTDPLEKEEKDTKNNNAKKTSIKKEHTSKKNKKQKNTIQKDKSPKMNWLLYNSGSSKYKCDIKVRIPEFFYGKNLAFLNNNNPSDRRIYFRHTADFHIQYWYRCPQQNKDSVYVRMGIRNKGVWGDPFSITSTTNTPIKELDTVFGFHKHHISRFMLWIRELYLQLSINDVLQLPFCNEHLLTIGAFPFVLGRGISLGAAYASDLSDMGFFGEYSIDQYTFGGLLSGDIIKERLIYNLYGGILKSRATTFDQTNLRIRGQQYGHRHDQARGFGKINYVIAGRCIWHPLLTKENSYLRLEPYALYNKDPEQKIDFIGDAKSDLFTLGIAGEGSFGNFECGFDTAFNLGHQTVFGWDANTIRITTIGGKLVVTNTHVNQTLKRRKSGKKNTRFALKVPQNQSIIELSPQTEHQNGSIIGVNSLGTLINTIDRFSDPFINRYRGFMFVYDMGYFIIKPTIQVCAAFGYASGDASPTRDKEVTGDSQVNCDYEGFIGLQESYSGTKVRSVFLLSGFGDIPRPLLFPSEEVSASFPISVTRFTNLVYAGMSGYYNPGWSPCNLNYNVNLLGFWTDFPVPFLDIKGLQHGLHRCARNYLGTEVNVFIEAQLTENVAFFAVGALFIPGSYYRDIKDRPLSKEQRRFLSNRSTIGSINSRIPLLGSDIGGFANIGLEFRF